MQGASLNDQVILATGGYDHTVKIWQAHSGMCLRSCTHSDSQVNCLEITPDKEYLAAGGYQRVLMYNLKSATTNPVVNYEMSKNVMCIGFQSDGKWMFTGGEDNALRIWDLRCDSPKAMRAYTTEGSCNSAAMYPNEMEIAFGDQNGFIYKVDIRTKKIEDQLIPENEASIQCVSIDPAGQFLAAINNKGNCYVWSLGYDTDRQVSKLTPQNKIAAHASYGLKCKFTPDSSYLVTTSADGTARVWSTDSVSLERELKIENQRWVWDIGFSADSQYAFTASSDNCARLWNIETGVMEREYLGHSKAVVALAFRDEII